MCLVFKMYDWEVFSRCALWAIPSELGLAGSALDLDLADCDKAMREVFLCFWFQRWSWKERLLNRDPKGFVHAMKSSEWHEELNTWWFYTSSGTWHAMAYIMKTSQLTQ